MHTWNPEPSVVLPIPNSSMFVFPTIIAPASLSFLTAVASKAGLYPSKIREPPVDGMSTVHKLSLTPTKTPERGPTSSPFSTFRSNSSASFSTESDKWMKLLSCGSVSRIRSRYSAAISTAFLRPERRDSRIERMEEVVLWGASVWGEREGREARQRWVQGVLEERESGIRVEVRRRRGFWIGEGIVRLSSCSAPSLLMAFGTAWIHGRKRAERLER